MITRTISGLSPKAISEYAERVVEHYDVFKDSMPANLDQLVRDLGGYVKQCTDLVSNEALTVRSRGDFTIYLPKIASNRRDHFLTAHEIGRYFLHYLELGLTGYQHFIRGSESSQHQHYQANIFATSLVMPEKKFKDALHHYDYNIDEVARLFYVSPHAAQIRHEGIILTT